MQEYLNNLEIKGKLVNFMSRVYKVNCSINYGPCGMCGNMFKLDTIKRSRARKSSRPGGGCGECAAPRMTSPMTSSFKLTDAVTMPKYTSFENKSNNDFFPSLCDYVIFYLFIFFFR